VQQRLRETGALTISFREGIYGLIAYGLQEAPLDGVVNPFVTFCSMESAHFRKETKESGYGHILIKRRGFRHVTNALLCGDRIEDNINPLHLNSSLGGRQKPGHHSDGRGFTCTVRSEESQYGSFLNFERNAVNRTALSEVLDQIVCFDHLYFSLSSLMKIDVS
jgi:hypothetical protein